jgi:hypothetical protein
MKTQIGDITFEFETCLECPYLKIQEKCVVSRFSEISRFIVIVSCWLESPNTSFNRIVETCPFNNSDDALNTILDNFFEKLRERSIVNG